MIPPNVRMPVAMPLSNLVLFFGHFWPLAWCYSEKQMELLMVQVVLEKEI